MATPTPEQALSHYLRQAAIAQAAAHAVHGLLVQRAPLEVVARLIARYQLAAASAASLTVSRWAGVSRLTVPDAFGGVSSMGYPVIEPVIATIDKVVPAPVEPIPSPWWEDATLFQHAVELLIASEVADAGRSASQTEMIGHGWTEYVRVLNPPSCPRCAILAGRRYRWSTGFQRHPGCDCQMVPVDDPRAADRLLTDPRAAFEAGQIGSYREVNGERRFVAGLSKADARAVADGADIVKVVNASRGLGAPGITAARRVDIFGRTGVKITTDSTTKRAAWRKANPTRPVRLRPEAIYRFAESPEDAVRLLKLYGYY